MALTQDGRLLSLETPLGKDKLLITRFDMHEAMSDLFEMRIEAICENRDKSSIDADKIIGKQVTVGISVDGDYENGPRRYFNGLVKRFTHSYDDHKRFSTYRLEVVPWLWLTEQISDTRVFQDMTVIEIISDVLDSLKGEFPDVVKYDLQCSSSYEKLDYCVQYRETNFHFLSRLMEHEGIFYFFAHSDGEHKLVIADHSVNETCPEKNEFKLIEIGEEFEDPLGVYQFDEHQQIHTGKYQVRDYHFQVSTKTLEGESTTSDDFGGSSKLAKYEPTTHSVAVFNKPGERLDKVEHESQRIADIRMDQEMATKRTSNGRSACSSMTSGCEFSFENSDLGDYLLTAVNHVAEQDPGYISGSDSGRYTNQFTCVPKEVVFRPPLRRSRPSVDGLESAVVVGPSGEELHTDKYGRVKIQFHWDRNGEKDDKSSCWVRVAQPTAGRRWGTTYIPRVGNEVLVSFLGGDVNEPVIVGSLYNSDQMPAYLGDGPDGRLSSNPNVTSFKSNSSPGGKGFNELRFNDTADEEQVFLHGQKDLDIRVGETVRQTVGSDYHSTVGNDLIESVGNDHHVAIANNQTESIGTNYYQEIGADSIESVGGARHLSVGSDRNTEIGGAESIDISADLQQKAGGDVVIEAGGNLYLKAGMNVVIEGGMQLSIKVGGNFVNISPMGVDINGTLVNINSGGSSGSAAGASPTAPEGVEEPQEPEEAEKDAKSGSKSCG